MWYHNFIDLNFIGSKDMECKIESTASDKKVVLQFIALTFCIAYVVSGLLIIFGQFGYRVYGMVYSLKQFAMNVPFAIYILSPAIASYIILKKNNRIVGFREWLKTVFYAKNDVSVYMIIAAGLILYFVTYIVVSGSVKMVLPFYMFFFSLPGNLFIGGLEEAGWMYVLQPILYKKYGFIASSVLVGVVWAFWHMPLFFIPGTNHFEGLINFGIFNVQVMSLSFFRSAIYRIAGKGYVFSYVLFHTMFNASSSLFGAMTWSGAVAANIVMILFSIIIVAVYNKSDEVN